jgi:hypothetical protein
MRVNFILNRFPARAPTPLTFRKGSGGKLYYFPPADPKLKPAAAEELVNTLKSSFQDFAKRAHAPR